MARRICLAVIAAMALSAVPALADSQSVTRVEQQAASLPKPDTPNQAVQNQTALQPAVDQAIASGDATVLTQAATSPDIAADVLRRSTVTTHVSRGATAGIARVKRVKAHAAGCWGSWANYADRNVGGAVLAWVRVQENGWCGNGRSITWYGGASHASWAWGPYCVTNYHTDYSWLVPFSWIHMGTWGSAGVSYPWGCASVVGLAATIRIAANGYADGYY